MPFALSLYAGIVVPSLLSVPQPIEFFLEVAPAYPSGNGEKAFFFSSSFISRTSELLDKMAEALRVDRQNFYTIAPGSAEDFMRTFFWLDEDSPGAIRLFQLVRNPGRQGPLMIPLYGTMIAMTGPHTLPWVCTSSMALWTSSCGNGFSSAGVTRRGRSPGKSILNGNSTGPIPATMAWKANIISLGGK